MAGWSDIFATGFFKSVTYDEPQSLRTGATTAKGAACKVLSAHTTYHLGLTATPVYNYGDEMWHIMQFIDDTVIGHWTQSQVGNGALLSAMAIALTSTAAGAGGMAASNAEAASRGASSVPKMPVTTSAAAVSGEVSLAAALSSKAAAGATLFIVAKSVDSPGMPVAVFRGSVGAWPVKFTLDDSQSMLPGRNLSSAGRVTIEARISQSGQPMPAAGDLQGSSGVINPSDGRPLKIVIDHVIS